MISELLRDFIEEVLHLGYEVSFCQLNHVNLECVNEVSVLTCAIINKVIRCDAIPPVVSLNFKIYSIENERVVF